MGDTVPAHGQRTASLSRAAESLAKAATKLSEAARAMSLVAEALSKGSAAKISGIDGSGGKDIPSDGADTKPAGEVAPPEDIGAGLPQPYRLLLDNEADVLLMLCSLVYDLPKVVCYFACGTDSLKLNKNLIDGVTQANTMMADLSNGVTTDQCYDKFLKERRSILLLSEMDIPSVLAGKVSDYTLIHVGWPADKRQYVKQRRVHHASTNILLAYSGDKDLYPSGSAIMSQTEAWPGDSGGFRASVEILRPLFEESLSEVPFEMKEEAYLDWIHSHSQQGARFISSWTPSALVSRANKFILGPLAYRNPRSFTQESSPQTPLADLLPEVSLEFVTQHGLQPAVDEGLLRVETEAEVDDSHIQGLGSNSAHQWSAEDTRARTPTRGQRLVGEERPTTVADTENRPDAHSVDTKTPESVGNHYQTNPPYRLLVDSEVDVLLFVCALIDKRQKVICYMPCGNVPLKAYKMMIESIAESPVHILWTGFGGDGYTDFLESNASVLLVPESLSPELEMEEDAWVIHVGWPASGEQYTTQRKAHGAHNNILVACSRDQSLYPSSGSIVNRTQPWPQDGPSFRASVSILRPLYEIILSEISLEMKTQVYLDWIEMHGIDGSRHVETWDSSMLVRRANEYLLDVWQWNGEHLGGADIPLPEVSREFVAENSLQSAVLEGLLRVEDDHLDYPPPPSSPLPRSDSVPVHTEFQHTAGKTYFVIDEEFDAIPLICFLTQKYNKVICFLEGQSALRSHQQLFVKIAGRSVIAPAIINNDQAINEAVTQFLYATIPTALLLAYSISNLPIALMEGYVDCCIYFGFSVPLNHVKRHSSLINCATTIIIMGKEPRSITEQSTNDIRKHPSAAIPLDLTESSKLTPMRHKTRDVLASDKRIVRALYTNHLYSLASSARTPVRVESAVRRVNQYAARVLLHGDPTDGSEIFPPVAKRPTIHKRIVDKLGLASAVDADLLTIGN
ncbi:unnamed protein product [Rhizoctonia solani]|uniref:Uncharacterized protein n=1 Tax=Rhizoctonia solani TaxID=456999 RepID=A0A8H3E9C9_9AGAM|nr:unnamed protein product [Rhizoctonia solani]